MGIKLLLVEDHDIVREGIRALLEGETDIEVCAESRHGEEAIEQVKKLSPDLVIVDIKVPVQADLELVRRIKKEYPSVKILILSVLDHESYLLDLLDVSAEGYILKNSAKAEYLYAIRKISSGGRYIAAEFTVSVLAKFKADLKSQSHLSRTDLKITDREMDVLNLVAEGKTNQEIANQLFTSVRTIETRRKNLLDKTGTTNTATLIKFAVQNGIVS